MKLGEVRKALMVVVTFAVTVLSTILAVQADLIPEPWLPWVHVALGVAGAYGVYRVRNDPPRVIPDGTGDHRADAN